MMAIQGCRLFILVRPTSTTALQCFSPQLRLDLHLRKVSSRSRCCYQIHETDTRAYDVAVELRQVPTALAKPTEICSELTPVQAKGDAALSARHGAEFELGRIQRLYMDFAQAEIWEAINDKHIILRSRTCNYGGTTNTLVRVLG